MTLPQLGDEMTEALSGDPSTLPHPALARLIGPTRSRALAALRRPRSTTRLAASIGCSLAAASEHARVLRDSGLITTERHGKSVMHSITALGWNLLSRRTDVRSGSGDIVEPSQPPQR
ncbi:helix-turn-helix domain-containing protein [Amycolatopsis sp. NPDC051061]|uniref:ArsR/SmtB family transcription factor n=1 Tax=Amycolatopsis sp. NPDC051061 TaxID=3155042 RepID=UPI0034447AF2